MTFRPARAIPAGITAIALAATLSVATAAPATAAESTRAVDDSVTVDANHSVTIEVLANDTAPAGSVVELLDASGNPATRVEDLSGSWTTDGSTVTHTPPDGRAGPRTIGYRITDPDGDTAAATVRVQVSSINPPTALQDFASLDLGESVTVDVLANDLRGSSRSTGAHFELLPETLRILDAQGRQQTEVVNEMGTFRVVDGRIAYEPADGYWGSGPIRYVVQDEVRQSTRATALNLTVSPTPDAVDDEAATEPGTAATIDVLENDVTPAGTGWSTWGFTVTPGVRVHTVEQEGIGVWTRDEQELAVFTPEPGFTGTASVDYMVINTRYASDVATISVTVDAAEAPVLAADRAQTPYFTDTTIDVLANDTAPEGAALDPASLRLVDASGELVTEVAAERGTWSVVDGRLAFAPEEGAYGTERATYSVATTEGATATAEVTVEVRTPRVISRGELIDHEFSAAAPSLLVDVLANDGTEGNSELVPSTLAISDHNGRPVPERTTAQGTWRVVDGQVEFTPAEGFEGQAAQYYLFENNAGFEGAAVLAVNVTWAVEASVDAQDDRVSIPRKGDVTVDVLANDAAVGGALDPSTLRLVGEDGELVERLTTRAGTWTVVDGEIRFEAHARQKGEASVEYVVGNGGATGGATLTVDVDQHHAGHAGVIDRAIGAIVGWLLGWLL